ncbi:MAG: J domain-containing protein [Mariniblastus sp.]|nr:J domain-containing protein [Mariniblastus sp.]
MAKSKNAILKALGIQSRRPHYYQLLGISRFADLEQVQQAVEDRLRQLGAEGADLEAPEMKSVVEAIKKAGATLSDTDQRAVYDAKFDRALAKANNPNGADNKGALDAPGMEDMLPPKARTNADAEDGNTRPAAVAQPIKMDGDSTIPMAIPLGEVKQSEPSIEDEMNFSEPSIGGLESLGKSESLSGRFKVRSKVRSKSKSRTTSSLIMPLTSMFFFVVGVSGLLYFVFQYMDREQNRVGTLPTDAVATKSGDRDADPTTVLSQSAVMDEPAVEEPPKVVRQRSNLGPDKNPLSDPITTDVMADSDNQMSQVPSQKDEDSPNEKLLDTKPLERPMVESASVANEPSDESVNKPSSTPLTFGENAAFRRLLQRADRQLFQRNTELAAQAGRQAQELLGPDAAVQSSESERGRLFQLAAAVVEMSGDLEGFWEEVKASGKSNDGDISIRETFASVVEAADDYIIIRSAGENLRFAYMELPAGLAMALAESTDKEDVPTWNIYKAAFYAANRNVDLKYRDRAFDCLLIAEESGHDMGYLRTYLSTNVASIGRPDTPSEGLSEAVQSDEVRAVKKDLGMPSSLESLSKDECLSWVDRLDEQMIGMPADKTQERATLCELNRLLAIQAGQVDLALESLQEERVWARVDLVNESVETFNQLIQSDLDRSNSRLCIEAYLRFLRSNLGDLAQGSKLRKLQKRMAESATKNGFTDLSRELARMQ